MRKMQLPISGLILMFIFSLSCKNSENNSNQIKDNEVKKETSVLDISGKYKMAENTCGFELIINKVNGEYSYNIKGKNGIVDIFGKLSVSNENGTYYINFTLPESFKIKTVEGILDNNNITIQNYGNAVNQYKIFEDCEDKYMEFKK